MRYFSPAARTEEKRKKERSHNPQSDCFYTAVGERLLSVTLLKNKYKKSTVLLYDALINHPALVGKF